MEVDHRIRPTSRKLRIAFSALWSILCLLLVMLWVRSYWRFDGIYSLYKNGMSLTLASNNGAVLIRFEQAHSVLYAPQGWKLRSHQAVPGMNVQWMPAPGEPYVLIPHWFPVLLSSMLAGVPWIQQFRRFSLRTLLIAMTLVAAILGIIVISN